jgi:hypothetical protein
MFQFALRRRLPAALALAFVATACGVAAAQGAAQTQKRPDPLLASEAVPAVVFRSSLAGYRRFQEQPVGSWQQANETVNRIGGWRAYAREASQPETPTAPIAAPAAAPVPSSPGPTPPAKPPAPGQAGHQGHQGHQERAKP